MTKRASPATTTITAPNRAPATSTSTITATTGEVSGALTSMTPSTASTRPYAAMERRSADAANVAIEPEDV